MLDLVALGIEKEGFDEVEDLVRIGNTNFIYGGLNLVYAPPSSGKSWQIVTQFEHKHLVIYLDTDGSNGKQFVKWCKDNNVIYVKHERIANEVIIDDSLLNKVYTYITNLTHKLHKLDEDLKPIYIIDSLTSVNEGGRINNAEDISPIMYKLNQLAVSSKGAVIIIDHATMHKDLPDGFKLEGNASAKIRTTVTVNRYIPHNPSKPESGGSFICERARGNDGNLRIGNRSSTKSVNIEQAKKWYQTSKFAISDTITKTEWTEATKNTAQLWLRDFYFELFNEELQGKTTYLKYKFEVPTAEKERIDTKELRKAKKKYTPQTLKTK